MRQPLTLALPRPARTVVADCLKPQGRVFFADDAYRTPDELVEGPSSPVIRRQLNDGNPLPAREGPPPASQPPRAAEANRLEHHGHPTSGPLPFYWGAGSRS